MKVNTYLKEQKVRERNRSENRRKGQTNWEKCGCVWGKFHEEMLGNENFLVFEMAGGILERLVLKLFLCIVAM